VINDLIVREDQLTILFDVRLSRDAVNDDELLKSFQEHGIKDALTCRYTDNPDIFEIVDGRRRYRLGLEAGINKFRITAEEMTDIEAFAVAFMKNHHRKSMSAVEEAIWIKTMVDRFELTQKAMGKLVNKSRVWVSRTIKFAEVVTKLPPEQRRVVRTERQVRELAKMSEEKKKEILDSAIQTGELASGRELERIASASKTPKEILEKWKHHDDDFIVYMLQEEAGLTAGEAADTLRKFRRKKLSWQERVRKTGEVSEGDPKAQMYKKLGEWYPLELIDQLQLVAPAKTLPTWQINARGFIRTLLQRTPANVKTLLLEEFIR
jgi:ParB/RepB/Spo0J family partition protein